MKYILLLTLSFFSIKAEAQRSFFVKGPRNISDLEVVDYGNIKIIYILNQSKTEIGKSDDVHILEIGDSISKYYSYNIFKGDSIYSDFFNKNPHAESVPNPVGRNLTLANKYFFGEYFKDYKNSIFSEYVYMPSNIPNYQYSEKMHDIAWDIYEDTLTVADYVCQKAICSFRGKNYTAWFSPNIPVNNGPWKFGGLPGLILKISDEHNDYVFECISIEKFKSQFAITTHDHSNYSKISREKLLKLWKDIFERYDQLVGVIRISGSYYPKKLPYKPLELE